jgi:hypothetical protein
MTWLRDYQIRPKGQGKANILIHHVQRIINNNKTPSAWTEEERRNPVIFDKQIQTFITMSIVIAKKKESGTGFSGGNFDFKDSSDSGYILELKYIDSNEGVVEVVKAVRERCGFSCITGRNSTSCYLADPNANDAAKESIMQTVCDALEDNLSKIMASV